jgi:arylsulfatase A-like enzyme
MTKSFRQQVSRREFLLAAFASTAFACTLDRSRDPRSAPNILFILADDLGYGDLSSFGRPDYRTPHIDSLAAQGLLFTQAYAGAAVCTPTRCALATGRYPARLAIGLEEPLFEANTAVGLPPGHPTLASLLQRAGYDTALIGKWHLGSSPEYGPTHHGYETFYGIITGAADYFSHKNQLGALDLHEGTVPVEQIGYLTDLLTRRAVDYVTRPRSRPFFLSLHYTAPHWPWQGPHDDVAGEKRGSFQSGGSLPVFAEMVRALDEGVGQVVQAIRSTSQDERTLVIFTSDNGGERYSFQWPLSDWKGSLWEGGIRVPAIVSWPRVIEGGRRTEQVAISMDWMATMLSAAGTSADPDYPLDGIDLLPLCRGERRATDRALYWRTRAWRAGTEFGPPQAAARIGRWKYLRIGDRERLFDLSVDPGEDAELSADHADVVARLRSGFYDWNAQMLPDPGVIDFPG